MFIKVSLTFLVVPFLIFFPFHIISFRDDLFGRYYLKSNEYEVAKQYFHLSRNNYNQTEYFHQASKCFSYPRLQMISCLNKIHGSIFITHDLWSMAIGRRRNQNNSSDCSYKTLIVNRRFHSLDSNDSHQYIDSFQFIIFQNQHTSSFRSLHGGTSFLILAYDQNYLISCSYTDTFNNGYHVTCPFYRISTKFWPSCVNLTVMVEYEHYIALSESLSGETTTSIPVYRTYNNLRKIVVDNKQYCWPISKNTIDNEKHGEIYHKIERKNKGDREFITGQWLSDSQCHMIGIDQCSLYLSNYTISAYHNHKILNKLSPLALGKLRNDQEFSEITRMPMAKNFSESYLFHPIVMTQQDHRHLSFSTITRNITFSPYDQSKMIHMIGSSHIRNAFDAITEYFGLGYYPSGLVNAYNIISYHSLNAYSSIFADDQADFLVQLCDSGMKPGNVSHTIVFQTGVWDLTFTPLRRVLKDPVVAHKLASIITRILNGNITCQGLVHFTWLTEIPSSVCLNDDDTPCRNTHGFRTNSAISALNEYYMDIFSNVMVRHGLKFTIIDSYAIILPRVQLLPDVEYDCGFHYHCKSYKKNYEPQYPLQLSHTPGGDAMVKTILLALSV